MPTKTPIILFFVVVFSFVALTLYIGGDALNGKVADGHYYVRAGARYKEVSRSTYIASGLIVAVVGVLPASLAFYFRRLPFSKPIPRPLRIALSVFFALIGLLTICLALASVWRGLYGP